MTARQFFDYLASYPQTRELAFELENTLADQQLLAAYRQSA